MVTSIRMGIFGFHRCVLTKVSEIAKLPKVNVSFADTENQHYVSISGTAARTRSRQNRRVMETGV